jgi:hypothetical protein
VDATSLLASACPEAKLVDPEIFAHEPLEVTWAFDNTVPDFIATEISRGDDDRCFLGFYKSEYEGTLATFLRFTEVLPRPNYDVDVPDVVRAFERVIQDGSTPRGPVRSSFYLYGADLAVLRNAGTTLSWNAALCLHAAFREPLARLHAAGWAHGALTTRRLRLVINPEPYVVFEGPAPVRMCAYRGVPVDPRLASLELATLSEAVCALALHPDAEIAALLADSSPGALGRLGQLLLARGAPIDELLADRLRGGGDEAFAAAQRLGVTEASNGPDLAPELTALWEQVATLCPLVAGVWPPDC